MLGVPILQVNGLVKNYGSFRAVDNLSFEVRPGEILGLLGPNGAGKTTTMHMLMGLTPYDAGSVLCFGKDFSKHKQEFLGRMNFASAYTNLQTKMSVWENLIVFAGLYGQRGIDQKLRDLLEYFEIGSLVNKKIWNLSAGQKTRANLVKALINDPEIVLLDEPTASLDPDIADKLLALLDKLRSERKLSILYTSHNMAEVTRLCDRVIFLDHGKEVAQGKPAELAAQFGTAELHLTFTGQEQTQLSAWLNNHDFRYRFDGHNLLIISTEAAKISATLFEISNSGIEILDIEIRRPTLEDVFIDIARN